MVNLSPSEQRGVAIHAYNPQGRDYFGLNKRTRIGNGAGLFHLGLDKRQRKSRQYSDRRFSLAAMQLDAQK